MNSSRSQKMRSFAFTLISLFFCFVLVQDLYAFSIEPARLEFSIPAGKQRGKTVRVDNSGSGEPLHIKAYVQDVILLPDGSSEFPAAGSSEWSCAKMIKVIPEEIDIPAGKKRDVRVTVLVPEDARGGYYGMLFFESSPIYTKGVGINFRIGGLIDIVVSKTEEFAAKLANLTFSKPDKIEVDIFNEGNVLIRPKGRIKVFNSKGNKIKQLNFNPQGFGVLPKTLRKFYVRLDETLAKGTYRIKAEIDYGTKYLLGAELTIDIE